MFVSHFLFPIDFLGTKLQRDALSMKENIFPFVEISYFRLIFGHRKEEPNFSFTCLIFFSFFGSDSFLWKTNFRKSWAATHQCNICFIRISSVFLSYLFDFPCFVLLSPLYVFYVHFFFVQFPFYLFDFHTFGSDSFLWVANFRQSWASDSYQCKMFQKSFKPPTTQVHWKQDQIYKRSM